MTTIAPLPRFELTEKSASLTNHFEYKLLRAFTIETSITKNVKHTWYSTKGFTKGFKVTAAAVFATTKLIFELALAATLTFLSAGTFTLYALYLKRSWTLVTYQEGFVLDGTPAKVRRSYFNFKNFSKAVQKEDTDALYKAAVLSTRTNLEEAWSFDAESFLQEASNRGHTEATNLLGCQKITGQSSFSMREFLFPYLKAKRAESLFSKAAEAGNKTAEKNLQITKTITGSLSFKVKKYIQIATVAFGMYENWALGIVKAAFSTMGALIHTSQLSNQTEAQLHESPGKLRKGLALFTPIFITLGMLFHQQEKFLPSIFTAIILSGISHSAVTQITHSQSGILSRCYTVATTALSFIPLFIGKQLTTASALLYSATLFTLFDNVKSTYRAKMGKIAKLFNVVIPAFVSYRAYQYVTKAAETAGVLNTIWKHTLGRLVKTPVLELTKASQVLGITRITSQLTTTFNAGHRAGAALMGGALFTLNMAGMRTLAAQECEKFETSRAILNSVRSAWDSVTGFLSSYRWYIGSAVAVPITLSLFAEEKPKEIEVRS